MSLSDHYQSCPIPKPPPRVVDRIRYKRELAAQERACRKAVKARDKGRCRVPGCRDRAVHLHHIVYRSKQGTWTTGNIASLCAKHHSYEHAHLIAITGNADKRLKVTGDRKYIGSPPLGALEEG